MNGSQAASPHISHADRRVRGPGLQGLRGRRCRPPALTRRGGAHSSGVWNIRARSWTAPVLWRFPMRCMPGKAAENRRAVPPLEAGSSSQCALKKASGLPMNR